MSAERPWLVLEITARGGVWRIACFETKERAEMRAEALSRGMRAMGDGRRYEVREVAG